MSVNRCNGHARNGTVSDVLNGDGGRTPGPDHDSRGKFARGNKLGSGNPFNRKLAAMREQLVDLVGTPGLERLVNALLKNAEAGDLASAKVLLGYVVGQPLKGCHPDALDVDEATRAQAAVPLAPLLRVDAVSPAVAAVLARVVQRAALHLAASASRAGPLLGTGGWEKVFEELNDPELTSWWQELCQLHREAAQADAKRKEEFTHDA
jgi:hypothetical protein